MSKLTVGVLRGGPSHLYNESLQTGGMVLKHLPEKYKARDIFISKDGEWHMDGMVREPSDIIRHVDVIWNGLHGAYGEDGKVQRILETFGTPYTGSNSMSSALSMSKHLSKQIFEDNGIKTPISYVIERGDDVAYITKYLFENFHLPAVVKPVSAGSSRGISIVRDYRALSDALDLAFTFGDKVLIEEFIRGQEATVGVINNFRDQEAYVLFPVEIVPHKEKGFYDFESKYSDKADHRCPGQFTDEQKMEIERIARAVHTTLNLRHYSRIDLVATPSRGVYVLEANTLPSLHKGSPLLSSLEAGGIDFPVFIDHVIGQALSR